MGKDLRRAYDGGWLIDGDSVFLEAVRRWLLINHFSELEGDARRLLQTERRRMRLRRVARNRG